MIVRLNNARATAWFRHHLFHRDDGPAVVLLPHSVFQHLLIIWLENDKLRHVGDAPVMWPNLTYEAWYQYGQLHRNDGPAIHHRDGHKEWWINGIKLYV